MSARSRSTPWWGPRRWRTEAEWHKAIREPWEFAAEEADRVGFQGVVGVDDRTRVHGQVLFQGAFQTQAPRVAPYLAYCWESRPWWVRLTWWWKGLWTGWKAYWGCR